DPTPVVPRPNTPSPIVEIVVEEVPLSTTDPLLQHLLANVDRNAGAGFTDIQGHRAEKSIQFVASLGLMEGVTKDKFAPNQVLTRAMVVTVLARMVQALPGKHRFADVPTGSYYDAYVGWAFQNGIVVGRDPSRFDPHANITREELAAILARFVQKYPYKLTAEAAKGTYADHASVSPFARDAVKRLAAFGLFGPVEGKFNPKESVTRGELAEVLKRLIVSHSATDK
ncbi:MAG: S-layer homology domain-containing protein, partial [Bacillota bacterium]|nr:S-layer homology domain-containing protein [Bacillota bacterium]